MTKGHKNSFTAVYINLNFFLSELNNKQSELRLHITNSGKLYSPEPARVMKFGS